MNVPGHGHVIPTLPVVQALVACGIEVLYYNTEEFRAKLAATGAAFRPYPAGKLTPTAITQAVSTHLAKRADECTICRPLVVISLWTHNVRPETGPTVQRRSRLRRDTAAILWEGSSRRDAGGPGLRDDRASEGV